MAVLEREYAVFNSMKKQLEEEHYLEWVVYTKTSSSARSKTSKLPQTPR